MLMDVKMPTIIGYFNIYEHCEFHANVCFAWKMFQTKNYFLQIIKLSSVVRYAK